MFNERQMAMVTSSGVNPVLSIRGRPEVRMGGFAALAGNVIAGRWAPADVKPAPATPPPAVKPSTPQPGAAAPEPEPVDTSELDNLLAGLESATEAPVETPAAEGPAAEEPAAEDAAAEAAAAEDDLDALLANLNAKPEPAAADETEADLDALLASLK
jgi:hypothetical protein